MKLYAICLVKNEDDVIAQSLAYATNYCDKVFVLDNGSTDRTWEIVQSLAHVDNRIVAVGQTFEPFRNGLRALVYNKHKCELSEDDWWLILDGDEFLAEDPRPVIEEATNRNAELIRAWFMQFYFTDIDYAAWVRGDEDTTRPIFERRHYYRINWQEGRFFRNQPHREWNEKVSVGVPDGLRTVYSARVMIRHYQFRDPNQIGKRLRTRAANRRDFRHVRSEDWRSVIRPARTLDYYESGRSWRFRPSGVGYYYRRMIEAKFRGWMYTATRKAATLFS